MSGWLVIERSTGWSHTGEKRDDHIFGPFQAPVVAQLWMDKRKEDVEALAKITHTEAVLKYHPNIYLIVPLFEPNWA